MHIAKSYRLSFLFISIVGHLASIFSIQTFIGRTKMHSQCLRSSTQYFYACYEKRQKKKKEKIMYDVHLCYL